jgi:hypothetical protein
MEVQDSPLIVFDCKRQSTRKVIVGTVKKSKAAINSQGLVIEPLSRVRAMERGENLVQRPLQAVFEVGGNLPLRQAVHCCNARTNGGRSSG